MDVQLLKQFQAKAGCRYTQQKANRLWDILKPQLNGKEQQAILIARGHAMRDEGRGELDDVCDAIKAHHMNRDVKTLRRYVVFQINQLYA